MRISAISKRSRVSFMVKYPLRKHRQVCEYGYQAVSRNTPEHPEEAQLTFAKPLRPTSRCGDVNVPLTKMEYVREIRDFVGPIKNLIKRPCVGHCFHGSAFISIKELLNMHL